VGAAAIAARIRLPVRNVRADVPIAGLAFNELDGPLVAVCGLAGGAGTSTVTFALAHQAAVASTAPVLVTEADPLRAGLGVVAGKVSPHPLAELARRVAEDAAPSQTFVEFAHGLRLVAAAPQRCDTPEPAAVRALLGEARAAHGLVVVDHATGWTASSPILAVATHILWTVPASGAGLAQARALFDSEVMPQSGDAGEIMVAIAPAARPSVSVSVRALRRLATRRCERLILVPYNDAAARGERLVDESVKRALAGLAPSLRRG
jgi:Flp pilus assembly CpaE family ATPase